MTTRVGSLFTGYGGLDMAVINTFGGEVAWYSEIDKAACQVLAVDYPQIENLGDITKVDWSQVLPVDIVTGGYPCQPFSAAGNRKGKNDDRHLWPYVALAIDALRPRLCILENVRGHLTLGFGDVLADLSRVGYDARWGVVRASDAGAPHGRARIFITAYPNSAGLQGHDDWPSAAQAGRRGHAEQGAGSFATDADSDGYGGGQNSAGMGGLEAGHESEPRQRERSRGQLDARGSIAWGKYGPAIRRWEGITRPAPGPTVPGTNGRPRLSPAFVEWMMGLPAGHVTGHGLRPAQELKMLGNGVCPQQAELALRMITAP